MQRWKRWQQSKLWNLLDKLWNAYWWFVLAGGAAPRVTICQVHRQPLVREEHAATGWHLTRLNNDAVFLKAEKELFPNLIHSDYCGPEGLLFPVWFCPACVDAYERWLAAQHEAERRARDARIAERRQQRLDRFQESAQRELAELEKRLPPPEDGRSSTGSL
jgi:hypothetical protein